MKKKIAITEKGLKHSLGAFFMIAVAAAVLSYYFWGLHAFYGSIVMFSGLLVFILYVANRGV